MNDIAQAPLAAPQPSRPPVPQRESAAQATAREFEAVFLGQMAKIMMETVEIGDQFSGGHGEEMFRGVLAEKLGAEMARAGGVGIAPAVMEQIIKMQGGNGSGQ
ncbi:rod-binding protein [Sphingosinicella sp. LY1275]|uniref:rod-binding protein n=1 Tax=Sphingosinicella sp. LY1275 TaxID=3095379 RepID=UPI002ADEFA7B|nr:rod-binding protein [Sphingosinicella sp. LY1275]MEA1014148.1 rod-binding protein [Sphingosinicella sp. LY1275]